MKDQTPRPYHRRVNRKRAHRPKTKVRPESAPSPSEDNGRRLAPPWGPTCDDEVDLVFPAGVNQISGVITAITLEDSYGIGWIYPNDPCTFLRVSIYTPQEDTRRLNLLFTRTMMLAFLQRSKSIAALLDSNSRTEGATMGLRRNFAARRRGPGRPTGDRNLVVGFPVLVSPFFDGKHPGFTVASDALEARLILSPVQFLAFREEIDRTLVRFDYMRDTKARDASTRVLTGL